jgi:peptidyl-prolyl cis-trans isomerase C
VNERLSPLLREPLFHFLILGLAIYGGYAWLYAGETSESDQQIIRVGEGERAWMRTSFEKRWNRPPTPAEMDGLVQEYVRETAFYREALAMGLDKDDTIVRRRLAQKLEFLVQDLLDVSPPTDADLEAYFETHQADYRQPDLITFAHVFVDPDKRDAATHGDAVKIRAALEKLDDPASGARELGDPFMLQSYYPERTEADISKLFGSEFAEVLAGSSTGAWHGPIASGYGLHLVYVDARETFPQPELAEVRERVVEDWTAAKRAELNEEYRKRLLEKYTVVIDDVPTSETVAQGESSP